MVFMTLTRYFSAGVITLLCFFALSVVTKADTIVFTATFSGSNENPPVNSSGIGTATLILNDVTGQAVLSLNFSGLSSAVAAAHFHAPADAHANAGVVNGLNFAPAFTLTAGGTAGSLSNYTVPFTLTAQQIAGLKNGLWYINIHTANFPGGEIRGQLYAVPEPATLLLLGAGLLSVTGALRKRRNRED
jgi:hypothetical protein